MEKQKNCIYIRNVISDNILFLNTTGDTTNVGLLKPING